MPKRGGSRGRKKASLSNLSRQTLKPEHREEYAKELTGGSDRAAALVVAAEIDSYLIVILQAKFFRLSEDEKDRLVFGQNAPLSNFASRILVAYGLGLIDEAERDDLDRIRRIRNAFAHSVIPLTFDHDLIAKECSQLWYRNVYDKEMVSFGDPKARYLLTALELRKIFMDRAVSSARSAAKSIKDRTRRKEYLAQIDAILKRDT